MVETSKFNVNWFRAQSENRTSFIWTYGVLGWGVGTAVLWTVCMTWANGWSNLLTIGIPALILFPIGGYFWGAIMWSYSQTVTKNRATGNDDSSDLGRS
jgi:hypothetical protein